MMSENPTMNPAIKVDEIQEFLDCLRLVGSARH